MGGSWNSLLDWFRRLGAIREALRVGRKGRLLSSPARGRRGGAADLRPRQHDLGFVKASIGDALLSALPGGVVSALH
jgi:hypothetical protein